jgi:hypothetical protein
MSKKKEDLKRKNPKYPHQKLIFTLRIPPSINYAYTFTKTGRRLLTKKAKKFIKESQKICEFEMKAQEWKKDHAFVWYYMDLQFYFRDKEEKDSHNCLTILMNSLQGVLYEKDYFIMPRIQFVGYDKNNPRLEIKYHPQIIRK